MQENTCSVCQKPFDNLERIPKQLECSCIICACCLIPIVKLFKEFKCEKHGFVNANLGGVLQVQKEFKNIKQSDQEQQKYCACGRRKSEEENQQAEANQICQICKLQRHKNDTSSNSAEKSEEDQIKNEQLSIQYKEKLEEAIKIQQQVQLNLQIGRVKLRSKLTTIKKNFVQEIEEATLQIVQSVNLKYDELLSQVKMHQEEIQQLQVEEQNINDLKENDIQQWEANLLRIMQIKEQLEIKLTNLNLLQQQADHFQSQNEEIFSLQIQKVLRKKSLASQLMSKYKQLKQQLQNKQQVVCPFHNMNQNQHESINQEDQKKFQYEKQNFQLIEKEQNNKQSTQSEKSSEFQLQSQKFQYIVNSQIQVQNINLSNIFQIKQLRNNYLSKPINSYIRIKYDSNILQISNFVDRKLESTQLKQLYPVTENYTFFVQTDNEQFIMAGGKNENQWQKNIVEVKYSQVNIFNLLCPKFFTSLTFNNQQDVFIINGRKPSEGFSNICEKFNITNQDQKYIANHLYQTYRLGTCYFYDLIFTFGGRGSHDATDYVCFYDIAQNN